MSKADEIEDSSAPLIEHLTELRTRLIRSVLAFLVGMVICFTVWNPIFNFLTHPLCDAMALRGHADCGLILIKLQEGFFVAVSISLLGGLILSFPFISYQLWRFVAPGLYKSEKNAFLPFMLASPFMFFLGASFAFYVSRRWRSTSSWGSSNPVASWGRKRLKTPPRASHSRGRHRNT